MKIALGADSAGKPLLDVIEAHLKAKPEHQVTNLSRAGFYADLSANLAHKVKDGEYQRGILSQKDGEWTVRLTGSQGSGILRSMVEADCFIVLDHAQGDVAPGDWVDVMLLEGLQ